MALNFSHRPIFLEGVSEHRGDRFCSPLLSEGDMKDCFDYGRDRGISGGCSQESISNDILDLLPSDPFGMEISTTFTAITGWLEDLEMDYTAYNSDVVGNNAGDYQLFTGLNIMWNNMVFQAFPGSAGFDSNPHVQSGIGESYGMKVAPVDGSCHGKLGAVTGISGINTVETGGKSVHLSLGSSSRLGGFSEMKAAGEFSCHDKYGPTGSFGASTEEREAKFDSTSGFGGQSVVSETNDGCAHEFEARGISSGGSFESPCNVNEYWSTVERSIGSSMSETANYEWSLDGNVIDEDGMPHMALNFALNYLAVPDLLSVERVCKSLRSTIQTDALLWRSIHIGQPLNEKITDDILLRLTTRAQGNLKCLSLVECPRITDDGLKQVLQCNPRLTKLCVPGCTRLSINGIIDVLKSLKFMGTLRVKYLRVGGLYGVTMEQFEELKMLLGIDGKQQQNVHKPHFFQREKYLSCEDDRHIDIEVCPRCENLRLVYDCPTDICRGREDRAQACRACTICVPRCVQCGRCINDGEYEENFCLEVLCSDCSLQQYLKCEVMQDENGFSLKTSIILEVHDVVANSG